MTLGIIIVALFASIFAGTQLDGKSDDNPGGASWVPELALDLQGGTQLILEPVTEPGYEVTDEDINQSIAVIRQRIDSSGVAEAEITRQGSSNIVVGIPGEVSDETIALIVTPAQMNFRPVLQVGSPLPAEAAADESAVPEDGVTAPEGDATEEPTDAETSVPTDEATPASHSLTATDEDPATEEPAATDESAPDATDEPTDGATEGTDATAGATPSDPSDLSQITPEIQAEFDALNCLEPTAQDPGVDPADEPLVTCADDGTAKYILGPVEIAGTEIDSATAGIRSSNGVSTGEYVVNISFTNEGTEQFAASTERLFALPAPQNAFAMVLDGLVISAPSVNEPIPNGQAEISGNFTRESSATLANQLNFGALPLTFEVQSQEQISATLGADQLEKGLIAGLIGLLLVGVYSIFQYRALGLVTVASLMIAGLITYGLITLLSWTQGYRLSLPGVAGLIVAIGVTADSFIVYFERIRDELRDGRGLVGSVERGWSRARRTIFASDTVNFLAAVILYLLAVGGVRGFAFTLGLTTLVDLLVVIMFTHPVMQLLAKTKFFGEGHAGSGLDPRRLGVESIRYAGRGRVSTPKKKAKASGATASDDTRAETADSLVSVGAAGGAGAAGAADAPAAPMTIAERRAAARRAQLQDAPDPAASGEVAADAGPPDGPSAQADESEEPSATNEEKH
ncbi:protein translocase subunit SecD [Paraoerskovia sediminicola]|uniref:protein translocase subunit SecD n=1 Tax=Paraoerskovia sediminicola TaxID=1138587 RepID=UPI002572FD14|nr:protein translocase subunit SecD [Paraoerskovia sediminicola]